MVKISIVVPLYNTEKYIERCLQSIIEQTYNNIEIIVVNDGSTDNSRAIVAAVAEKDDRIRIIDHNENKGLYHSRITGVEQSSGEYIGFVDSDDYISCDYYRTLVRRAQETGADITVGKIVHENENGDRYIHNIYDSYDFGVMEGEEAVKRYWEQEGRCFIWHTIWNKLYSREVWKKSLPILKRQKEHLIMTEDFVFSSVLFNKSTCLSCVKYGSYYYYKHSGASTSISVNIDKFRKNIKDLKLAFDFVGDYVRSDDYCIKAEDQFKKWNDLYRVFWRENIQNSLLNEQEKQELFSLLDSCLADQGTQIRHQSYFYSVTSDYDNRYNDIVNLIKSNEIKVISFDIFDTAIVRPVYRPSDMFMLLNKDFTELDPTEQRSFSEIRMMAEKELRRKKIYENKSPVEDISLDDIYEYISMISFVKADVLIKMKEKELEAERRLCTARNSVMNLYYAAVACGKKIWFTSDMYLDSKDIKRLLKEKGYTEYDGLLVSSCENATKRTGTLYDILICKTGCRAEEILHIGDNWWHDVENAELRGIKAVFFPSAIECLQNHIPGIASTHSCCAYTEPEGNTRNMEKALEYLGTRTALAVAALKLYDNPFISYNQWSDMNCQPSYFGYYALGMHLLGFVKWIIEKSVNSHYDMLAFISRDGYLPIKAYEIIKQYYENSPDSKYIYTSRKAAVSCGIISVEDMLTLYDKINPERCTYDTLANMLSPVLSGYSREALSAEGIKADESVGTYSAFFEFIKIIARRFFDKNKALKYNSAVSVYLGEKLTGKVACVDIGYSGRTQEMLGRVIGRPVDAFYIHKNDDCCCEKERKNGFRVFSFYDHTPSITGAAREMMFSEYAPSCIGYNVCKGTVQPVFDEFTNDYPTKYLIDQMQGEALKFVEDFCSLYGSDLDIMFMRNEDVSYPYEFFLNYLTEADSKMFECCDFEDDMWAGTTLDLPEYWKRCISYHKLIPYYIHPEEVKHYYVQKDDIVYQMYVEKGIINKNIIIKALYWLIMDKNFFKKRIKDYIKRREK